MTTMRTMIIQALYAQADAGTYTNLYTASNAELDQLAEIMELDMDKIRSDYHFNNMIEDDYQRCRTAFD